MIYYSQIRTKAKHGAQFEWTTKLTIVVVIWITARNAAPQAFPITRQLLIIILVIFSIVQNTPIVASSPASICRPKWCLLFCAFQKQYHDHAPRTLLLPFLDDLQYSITTLNLTVPFLIWVVVFNLVHAISWLASRVFVDCSIPFFWSLYIVKRNQNLGKISLMEGVWCRLH